MAKRELKGVGGVLGGLISPPAPSASEEPAAQPASQATADEANKAEAAEQPAAAAATGKTRPAATPRTQARRGRPPGRKAGESSEKEKVTLRISKELMDDYREWSWDERCQLGELVERAMSQYHKNRTRQKSQ